MGLKEIIENELKKLVEEGSLEIVGQDENGEIIYKKLKDPKMEVI